MTNQKESLKADEVVFTLHQPFHYNLTILSPVQLAPLKLFTSHLI